MKKRIKGLFALCLAFCIALLGTPSSQVYAEGNTNTYTFNGSTIGHYVDSNWEEIEELVAGDILSGTASGGFVVFNSNGGKVSEGNPGKVLTTGDNANPGYASWYPDPTDPTNSDKYEKDERYYYFSEEDLTPEKYVVPDPGPGYHGYKFDDAVNTLDGGAADKQYCTEQGMKYPNQIHSHPVYFLYLEPIPNDYTIHFDANGGTGTMADQKFTYGTTLALSTNAFTNGDRTFAGWNTEADGTGRPFGENADGSTLPTEADNVIVTLYAQWTVKPPETPAPEPEEPKQDTPEPEVTEQYIPEQATPERPADFVAPKTADHSSVWTILSLLLLDGLAMFLLRRRIYQKS